MRLFVLTLAILALAAMPAIAAPGDQWILGIHHLNQAQGFTETAGTGYNGPHSSGNSNFFGKSYSHFGAAGDISRVYWELSGNSINTGRPVPTTTEQYTIEYFGTPQPNGRDDYQPIESQFHGEGGEEFSQDSHIPWAGQFGTNHQWLALSSNVAGQWRPTGPGPQAPDSDDFDASGFGTRMWLTRGSWMYGKWDFGFEVNRSWSAIRLTQVTLDGDHNRDGVVNSADYAAWRKSNIGGDGGYDSWRQNFGMTAPGGGGSAGSSAVPEPASMSLLIMGLASAAWLAARPRVRTIRST